MYEFHEVSRNTHVAVLNISNSKYVISNLLLPYSQYLWDHYGGIMSLILKQLLIFFVRIHMRIATNISSLIELPCKHEIL